MGNVNEKIHDPLIFCADQTDIILNFVVITNGVVKKAKCISCTMTSYGETFDGRQTVNP